MEVELRKPYKISELIEIATKDYWVVNERDVDSDHLCPDTGIYDLQLYTQKFEEEIYEDLICYLEDFRRSRMRMKKYFRNLLLKKDWYFYIRVRILNL